MRTDAECNEAGLQLVAMAAAVVWCFLCRDRIGRCVTSTFGAEGIFA